MSQRSFVQSLKTFSSNALSQVSCRLQLLGFEFAEEKNRIISILIAALLACFFIWLAFALGAVWLIAYYWDTPARLSVIGWLASSVGVIALIMLAFLYTRIKQPNKLFAHSLAELDKDKQSLESLE